MVFITSFIKSINAFGAISGILGTLIGFSSGIYMPLSILPKFIQKISSLIPFTHMTIHLKRLLLSTTIEKIKLNVSPEAYEEIIAAYGYNYVEVLGLKLDITLIFILSCIVAILLLIWSALRLTKKIIK